jgi:hypothetical protein
MIVSPGVTDEVLLTVRLAILGWNGCAEATAAPMTKNERKRVSIDVRQRGCGRVGASTLFCMRIRLGRKADESFAKAMSILALRD